MDDVLVVNGDGIPFDYITEWRAEAPWTMKAQVEQDLLLSRAVVSRLAESEVANLLAFRGRTALFKPHVRPAASYSEDIDLSDIEPFIAPGTVWSFEDAAGHLQRQILPPSPASFGGAVSNRRRASIPC